MDVKTILKIHSFTTEVSEYIPSRFSVSTISSFKNIENKLNISRGKDCMETFCKSLREHAMEMINFQNNKK